MRLYLPRVEAWLRGITALWFCRKKGHLHTIPCNEQEWDKELAYNRHFTQYINIIHTSSKIQPYRPTTCDTQVFIWLFQKDFFIWLEGSDLKNFFKRTLTLKYFSLWQKFYLDSTKICLWSWRFLLFTWTQDKIFSLGKWLLKISLKFALWLLENSFATFNKFLLAMALVQIHSPKPSLTFGSWFASNPASWTSPYDYFSF